MGRDLSSLPGAPLDLDQKPRPAPILFFMPSLSPALCGAERDWFDRCAYVTSMRLQNASRSSWRQPPPRKSKVELGSVRFGDADWASKQSPLLLGASRRSTGHRIGLASHLVHPGLCQDGQGQLRMPLRAPNRTVESRRWRVQS